MQIKFKPQLVRNLQRHFRTLNFPSFKVIFWSLYKKGADKKKKEKRAVQQRPTHVMDYMAMTSLFLIIEKLCLKKRGHTEQANY